MSHSTYVLKNKYRKQPVVHFRQYLENLREPRDVVSRDTPRPLEAELIEGMYLMKRRVRRLAYRMRSY